MSSRVQPPLLLSYGARSSKLTETLYLLTRLYGGTAPNNEATEGGEGGESADVQKENVPKRKRSRKDVDANNIDLVIFLILLHSTVDDWVHFGQNDILKVGFVG